MLAFDGDARAKLGERLEINAGRMTAAVQRRQRELYQQPDTQKLAAPYARDVANLALQVSTKVVTAYRSQPIRGVADATPDQRRALAKVIKSSLLPGLMPWAARTSWWCGPVLLIPWPSPDGTEIRWRAHGASLTAVVRDGVDVVAAMAVERFHPTSRAPLYVAVADSTGVYRLELDRDGSTGRVLESYPAPRCLAVEVRTRPHDPVDPTGEAYGNPLHDATVDAGFTWADMSWRRKAQSGKQAVLGGRTFGNQQDSISAHGPEQQVFDPEGAVLLGDGEALNILDLDTSPSNFVAHLAAITATTLANYGLDLAAPLNSAMTFEISAASIATERAIQTLHLTEAEERAVAATRDAANLWCGASLPLGDAVVLFAEQHAVSDPLRREELYAKKAARGGTNPIQAYMLDHPGVTEDDAREAVMSNIAETTAITATLAARNAPLPANVDTSSVLYETPAQINGRAGGGGNN